MERFAQAAALALTQVLAEHGAPLIQAQDLEIPPDPTLGDFGFPCFKWAKTLRLAPALVAKSLAEKIQSLTAADKLPPEITVSAVGPYVNFSLTPTAVTQSVLRDVLSATFGALRENSRGSWVLEFSSPNIAKPLNIYHLRPTALGAALDRIGRLRGYRVISINHLGDWGKQYGMLVVAFERYGSELPANPGNEDLVKIYVKINADAANDPTIEQRAREAFVKLEQGDPTIVAFWQRCVDIGLKEFMRLYARLGVSFDHIWGESYYKDQLAPMIEQMRARGVLVESEGAWVIPVTDRAGKEIPPCIVQKTDGATIYATRDLAAAIYRFEQFQFDRMTYIVGQEQKLHFEQVFGALRKLGHPWESRCEHVPFGLYRFKDAKMSTRKGNFVTLESVLEEAKSHVREIMQTRAKAAKTESGVTDPALFEEICEKVAIGAVVFHDLHTDPSKDVEFDLSHVVDFDGETGPYLQYAHTRCLGILRKAGAGTPVWTAPSAAALTHPLELTLIKRLAQMPMTLDRSLSSAKASHLAHFLVDVVQAFGVFYRECQVLGQAPEVTAGRLLLIEATRKILAQGLGLLGIPLPDRM